MGIFIQISISLIYYDNIFNLHFIFHNRWHVRTKENIARVRKDEAEAAEKLRQEQLRIDNAEREARLNLLKQKSKKKLKEEFVTKEPTTQSEHINFFADIEHTTKTSNKEHDKDVKEKKEEYEKQIGYLTYLGQDTNEALGKKNWYEVPPEQARFTRRNDIKETYNKLVLKDQEGVPKDSQVDVKDGEIAWKAKQRHDPFNNFKHLDKYQNAHNFKSKLDSKEEHSKSKYKKCTHQTKKNKTDNDKINKIQMLREARLKREQQERKKTEMFLSNLCNTASVVPNEKESLTTVKPKYNSQFNPELARQNYT